MVQLFCQVLHRPDRLTFIWSQGASSFEPYHLTGHSYQEFWARVQEVIARREEVLAGHAPLAALARAGYQLHCALFPADAAHAGQTGEIQEWLQNWRGQKAIDSLALLCDDPGSIPWNLVYDQDPDQDPTGGPQDQQAFWGVGYNLAVGRRASSLWPVPWLVEPHILLVVDPQLLEGAGDLIAWANSKGLPLVQTRDSLHERLREDDPDFVYLFGRSAGTNLLLGDETLSVEELHEWLSADRQESVDPVVFANLCQGKEQVEAEGPAVRRLARLFPGLIACDRPLPAASANDLGLKFLAGFLYGGEPVGKELQRQRGLIVPEGLLCHCYCPPNLRVTWDAEAAIQDESAAEAVLRPLPDEPYRPLVPYDSEERALLAGREGDLRCFSALLDQAETRLLLLHGSPGVGKTSFLHAGVVPFLEEDCRGYWALRDRTPEDSPLLEKEYPVLATRASSDLAGQLAEALCAFCSQPYSYVTPTGKTVVVDLPNLLHGYVYHSDRLQTAIKAAPEEPAADNVQAGLPAAGEPAPLPDEAPETDPRSLWEELEKTPDFLGQLLHGLTGRLPFELLVLIEQGEELFTQAQAPPEIRRRQRGLAMLAAAARQPSQCKLILSLRTEFCGRLLAELPHDLAPAAQVGNFLLTKLPKQALVEAILLPTATDEIPYSSEVPYQKYQFQFEEGLPSTIVQQALDVGRKEGSYPLPLIQAVCASLVEMVKDRSDRVIRAADLKNLGGVGKALNHFVEGKLRALPLPSSTRKALRAMMQGLYTRQPDGTLGRDLVPVRTLAAEWDNRTPFEEAVQLAAEDPVGLLEIQRLLVDGKEGHYLSLRHDASAQVGVHWEEEKRRQAATTTGRVDLLWIMLPLMVLLVSLTFYLTRRNLTGEEKKEDTSTKQILELEKKVAEFQKEEEALRLPLYGGLLASAEKAWHSGNLVEMRQLLLSHQRTAMEVDGRGFEWYYLWRLANSERATLAGHRSMVGAVAASPDGGLLATASHDGTIWLWNVQDGKERARLRGHQGPVHALAFAADGKTLASAGADKTVLLWDMSLGKDPVIVDKPARKLTGHQGSVLAVAFAPNRPLLASAGEDRTVILWDAAQGKEQKSLKEHQAAVQALAFAPDGATLASAAVDGTVILWDPAAMTKRQTWKASNGSLQALAFAPDSKTLAAGGSEQQLDQDVGVVRLWEVASVKETGVLLRHAAQVFTLAFAPDGKTLATGGTDNCVRFWDPATGGEQAPLKGHLGWIKSLTYAGNQTLASGSFDGTAKLWEVHRPPEVLAAHKGGACALAFFADDRLLASGGYDGNVRLWEPATGQLRGTLPGHKGAVLSVALTGQGDAWKLAAACFNDKNEGEIKLWELKIDKGLIHSKEGPTLQSHTGGVSAVAFAPNGLRLASASVDKTVIVWDPASAKIVHKLVHPGPVHCLAFNRAGTWLATGGSDPPLPPFPRGDEGGVARIWDPATGKEILKPIKAHTAPITSVVFADNDIWLVTTSFDQTMKAWELRGGVARLGDNMRGHAGPVLASVVTPRGEVFASAGADHLVRLWDWRRGQVRFALTGHTAPVRALAVSADRLTMASASLDGTVRLWRAVPAKSVDLPERTKDMDRPNAN